MPASSMAAASRGLSCTSILTVTCEHSRSCSPPRGRRLIVTDSVFSMAGDCAPLHELVALARVYHTSLFLDEAHATGVLGPRGAGLADAEGLSDAITVQMGTLGKALGGAGAY